MVGRSTSAKPFPVASTVAAIAYFISFADWNLHPLKRAFSQWLDMEIRKVVKTQQYNFCSGSYLHHPPESRNFTQTVQRGK
jgi:hypothetical protein